MEPSTIALWIAAAPILVNIAVWLILKYAQGAGDLTKRLLAAGVAVAISAAGLAYEGKLDTADLGRTWLLVFMAATTLYVVIWKPIADATKSPPMAGIA